MVISNDSGLMHLAAALGLPQVGIYGSTTPANNPPLNKNAQICYLNISCSPCEKRTCPYGHYDCLTQLTPDMVIKKIEALLP